MSLSVAPNNRRLSTASLAFHSGNKHRFSRSGSMMRPTIGASTPESMYAKQAYTGQPVSMMNELSRLEELKKIQMHMDHEEDYTEKRNGFIENEMRINDDNKPTRLMDVRLLMFDIVENQKFESLMMMVIVFNSIILVVQWWSVDMRLQVSFLANVAEPLFLSIYLWESVVKIIVYKTKYFKKRWNLLDFTIVTLAMVDFSCNVMLPIIAEEVKLAQFQSQYFKISKVARSLRGLKMTRSLRMFRIIKAFDSIQDLVRTVFRSFHDLLYVFFMLTMFYVIFAMIGFQVFGPIVGSRFFDTFALTATTLMQVLTMDDWFEIVIDMSQYSMEQECFMFLLAYQIVTYFICLNLFIAVLVDNFQLTLGKKACKAKFKEEVQEEENALVDRVEGDLAEISDVDLRARLANLNEIIGEKPTSEITYESSDSDDDPEEIQERVISNIRSAHPAYDEAEMDTACWYFRLNATLEKHLHIIRDQMATHDRIIDLIVDDQEEMNLS